MQSLVHRLQIKEIEELDKKLLIAVVAVLILGGISTGYFLAKKKTSGELILPGNGGKIVKTEKVVGSTDKVFKDTAEGTLEKGGIDGEGSHKLIREGGPSQTAYLTSSIINLDEFVGKKVRVWGETFAAEKAGWLMDVGRVEILE